MLVAGTRCSIQAALQIHALAESTPRPTVGEPRRNPPTRAVEDRKPLITSDSGVWLR